MKIKFKVKKRVAVTPEEKVKEYLESAEGKKLAEELTTAYIEKPPKKKVVGRGAHIVGPSLQFNVWAKDVKENINNLCPGLLITETAGSNRIDIQENVKDIKWRICIIGMMDERFIITYYFGFQGAYIKGLKIENIQAHELIKHLLFIFNNRKEFEND